MRWIDRCMSATVVLLASSGPLWAKIPDNPGPPATPKKMIVYGSYIAIGVLLAAVLSAAFKPSKRGHQD